MTISARQRAEKQVEGLLIENEISIYRFNAHLRQRFLRKLSVLERSITAKIAEKGIETLTRAELKLLLKKIAELVDNTYIQAGNEVISQTNQLQEIEAEIITDIYNSSYGQTVLTAPEQTSTIPLLIAGVALADWFVKQSGDLKFKLNGAVRQASMNEKPTPDIIYDINAHLNASKRNAETLIKTAVSQARSNAHAAIKKENQSALIGEQHISVLDAKTSVICGARSGLVWDLEKNPVGHQVSYAVPPLHPNCRSYLKLLTKSWRELGLDEDEINEKQGNLTYEEWLKGKTPAEQDQILGKGKADLWRRGVITFSDMLDQSGRPLTLEELRAKTDPNHIVKYVDTRAVSGVKFTLSQLQKKYKHAEDFGLSSSYSKLNAKKYQEAIIAHLNDVNTRQFGTYLYSKQSKVYYNDTTGMVVVLNVKGDFITAFIPSDVNEFGIKTNQLTNFLNNGALR